MPEKTYIKLAIAVYILVVLVVVLGNSFLCDFDFHTNYTISRYIGLSTWSALLFLMASLAVFYNVLKYVLFLRREHHMNKIWSIVSILTVSALIGVGIFPVGYFDQTFGDFGVVSTLHRSFACAMFCLSIPMIFLTTLHFRHENRFLIPSTIFVVYGLFFVFCYHFQLQFFMNSILFFESAFLAYFLSLLLIIPVKESKTK